MAVVWMLLLGTVGTLLGLLALLAVVGLGLPREHRCARALRLACHSPGEVWAVLADHAREPDWRRELQAVERREDHHGRPVWEETARNGQRMRLETLEAEPPRRLVRRILEGGGPFGGTWTFDLVPEGEGTRLRLTEDGWIANPVFRSLARFVFGHHRAVEAYLRNLARRLGETSDPEPA